MIVHINGMPGVGKLTVARLLAQQLGATLVDNHSIIDTITLTHALGTPAYEEAFKQAMDGVLGTISEDSRGIWIFTNALAAERDVDRQRLDRIRQFALVRERLFLQVHLHCSTRENRRRIQGEGRLSSKLTDPEVLDHLRDSCTIYHPETPHSLSLDTTALTAAAAATLIAQRAKSLLA